jgi:hypothetical protein
MPKAEISWKRTTAEGLNLQIYAQHVGRDWIFYSRKRRYQRWEHVPDPPLEDWLLLLDALHRSINRRRFRPEEEARLKQSIRERFPNYQ